jgi:hypothetical protein
VNQPLLQMDLRLVVGALVVLAGAVIAIWLVGRRLRADLGPSRSLGSLAAPSAPSAPSASANVVRELQARGLATPAQLANMTETERQLLFATAASAINRTADAEERPPSARTAVSLQDLPPLFCPLCGYRLEQFTSVPPVTGMCETCKTRVIVRRDGARLLLTVVTAEGSPDARL